MITESQITPIGTFGKAHGVEGEINLIIDRDIDVSSLSCIILDIDGIYVPFFFNSVRPRGNGNYLVKIDDINSEARVSAFVGNTVYGLRDEVSALDDSQEEDDEDGFYASDFIGYEISAYGGTLQGHIMDVDDSTDNYLFVVRTLQGKQILIPVADEFIVDIDTTNKKLELELPDGLELL